MDDHPAKPRTQTSEVGLGHNLESSEVTPQLALEWDRLRFERQKYALEVRLKRREFREKEHKNLWQDLLTNPVTIAIVGGLITVITALVTNYFNASETRRAEAAKAQLAEQSAKETLQADLIKKFVESLRTEIVRQNLRFLVDAGLIPGYADSIKKYLDSNPGVAPQIGGGIEFVPSGASVAEDVKARIQKAVNQFIIYLQSLGFHGLDQNVTVFVYSKDKPPPKTKDFPLSGDDPAAYYEPNLKTIFIHELITSDVSLALSQYATRALFVSLDSTDNFSWNEIEGASALYLTASFTNSPITGTSLGPWVRKLDSATSYDRSSSGDSSGDYQLKRSVPWAAALWACREQVGKEAVDDLILPMWLQVMKGPRETDRVRENDRVAEEFGKALIAAPPPLGSCFSTERTNRKLP
jgi:hypothetical protein